MPDQWSLREVKLIVNDYFAMLTDELSGKKVNKSFHRKALLPLLDNRSEGSIEYKHQNISAVLIILGQPYIRGYLPRYNYQKILEEAVIDYLTANPEMEVLFERFAEKDVSAFRFPFERKDFISEPPRVQVAQEPYVPFNRKPIKINYLEKEQSNQRLGMAGEELVYEFEKYRLKKLGREKLARQVEWISRKEGDGAGFDILSKEPGGRSRYIEVKTTRLGKETPFYFTRNELDFSIENRDAYHLYRLFDFDLKPRMFIKQGDFSHICLSTPWVYRGYF